MIAKKAAAAIEYVLVNASGLNSRPSCASSVNTGRNDTVTMSSEKKSDGPTSRDDSAMMRQCGFLPRSSRQVLVGVLDHHDAGVDHRADRHRDAAQRHDVDVETLQGEWR